MALGLPLMQFCIIYSSRLYLPLLALESSILLLEVGLQLTRFRWYGCRNILGFLKFCFVIAGGETDQLGGSIFLVPDAISPKK